MVVITWCFTPSQERRKKRGCKKKEKKKKKGKKQHKTEEVSRFPTPISRVTDTSGRRGKPETEQGNRLTAFGLSHDQLLCLMDWPPPRLPPPPPAPPYRPRSRCKGTAAINMSPVKDGGHPDGDTPSCVSYGGHRQLMGAVSSLSRHFRYILPTVAGD